jgi:nitrate reductase gamma subunit
MSRLTVLFGFALFGYVLGFLAFLIGPSVADVIARIGIDQNIVAAILAGIAGGFLMVITVLVWSAVD